MAKKRGGPPILFTTGSMIEAVREKEGCVRDAAILLDCKEQTIYMRALYEPELQKTIDDAREAKKQALRDNDINILSSAYKSAQKLNDENHPTFVMFTLKALAGWNDNSSSNKEMEMNPAVLAQRSQAKSNAH